MQCKIQNKSIGNGSPNNGRTQVQMETTRYITITIVVIFINYISGCDSKYPDTVNNASNWFVMEENQGNKIIYLK